MRAAGEGPKPDETLVGVGRLGEPVEQERQQLLHEPRGAGQAPRELTQGLAGPVGIGEAEGGEPLLGSIRRKTVAGSPLGRRRRGAACRRAAGERLEQGPEEQSLVDRPSGALMMGEDGVEAFAGRLLRPPPEAEHPCQAVPRLVGRRARCGPGPPRRAGAGARRCAGNGTQSPGPPRPRPPRSPASASSARHGSVALNRRAGSRPPWTSCSSCTENSTSRIPPRPRLSSRWSSPRLATIASARAFIVRSSASSSAPKRRDQSVFRGRLFEQAAGGGIAGGVARFQQCLELPGTGPPAPVARRRNRRTGRARRSGPRGGGWCRCGTRGEAMATTERASEGSTLGGIRRDEDDVDVARVVELLRAVLAHGDDGEAVRRPRQGGWRRQAPDRRPARGRRSPARGRPGR